MHASIFILLQYRSEKIYACIIKIYISHEVKNQRALVITTSQRMINGQDIIIHMEIILCDPDKINIPCLFHDTRLCHIDVKVLLTTQ